jgi:hypothetical protein
MKTKIFKHPSIFLATYWKVSGNLQFFFLQNLAILSHFSLKVLCIPRLKSDVLGPSKSLEPTKTCPQVPNWAAHDCHVPCQLPSLKV